MFELLKRLINSKLVILLPIILMIGSCRKNMYHEKIADRNLEMFTVPEDAPRIIKRISNYLKNEDEKRPFSEYVLRVIGKPIWRHSTVLSSSGQQGLRSMNSSTGSSDTIVLLPFVLNNSQSVNNFLVCKVSADSLIEMRLIRNRGYKQFGYKNSLDSLSSEFVATQFMIMNHEIFGDSLFRIKDSSLFKKNNAAVKSLRIRPVQQSFSGKSTNEFYRGTRCYEITTGGSDGQLHGVAPGENYDFSFGDSRIMCVTTWTMVVSGSSGGSGGFSFFDPWAGYNGGGGTNTNPPPGYPPNTWADPCATDPNEPQQPTGTFCDDPGWSTITIHLPQIIPDTSITNNPIIKCVYDKLMDPTLTHGLKTILTAFDQSSVYHVKFKVEDMDPTIDGHTSPPSGNEWIIRINKKIAADAGYSRIWLASTFIHEAFHAKLRQHAIAVLGTDIIQNWPKNIDDMTLSELATYYQQSAEGTGTWGNIGHDWMVNNIDAMAISIRNFVQKNYLVTYAKVGENIQAYRALAYMGLSGSKFYQEKVIDAGLRDGFAEYRRDLSEGGKCSD